MDYQYSIQIVGIFGEKRLYPVLIRICFKWKIHDKLHIFLCSSHDLLWSKSKYAVFLLKYFCS